MPRIFAAAMRRANRLMRPYGLTRATRSMQSAMTDLMVKSAIAPLAVFQPKQPKVRRAPRPKVGRSLGVVLKQIRDVQSMIPGMPSSAGRDVSPRIPVGAQYLARTHRSAMGTRRYKLYLPASQPKRPKGLILMLHGCNQSPDDFAVGTHMNALAERHGLAIAYPAQTTEHNAAACWNWFKPGDQQRGVGEPAILATLARKLGKEFGLRRDSVFVAGLSAGGSMAAILADVYPDVFAAAGVHSGMARGAASNVVTAMAAMRNGGSDDTPAIAQTTLPAVRRIVFQGDGDSTVNPSNAGVIVDAALGDDATPTRVSKRSVRGRGYVRSDYAGTNGGVVLEMWMLDGMGHAWSGGSAAGSYTDPKGPDASAQMVRFFLAKSA